LTSTDEDLKQQIVDDENLRLLRIGYYISAGLTAFASVLILLYTFFFSFIFMQASRSSGTGGVPPSVGRVIAVLGILFVFLVVGFAVLQFLTGQRLKERRSRKFCMVIAAITCLSIPYGTFLGVCTFLVLLRPTVQRSFEKIQT